VLAIVVGTGIALVALARSHSTPRSECQVDAGGESVTLGLDQAANAATIAAVGKRAGLPDHAVTVALAAAFQESHLRNLTYGDRDSLGLFQQRPSQGWGTPDQLTTPSYAAAAFYRELERVDGWETLPITEAAQRVQRSGAPDAYAKWEPDARTLAIALTGEQRATLACSFPESKRIPPPADYHPALQREVGVSNLDASLAPATRWVAAAWLVSHAHEFGITSVALDGHRWTPQHARWKPDATAGERIEVVQARAS
jgi:hypothetical protein